MSKQKANHWVPRAYLRWFAADEKREKIWTFPSKNSQAEKKSIDKVAVSFWLYVRDVEGKKDTSLEEKFSNLEQSLGPSFWGKLKDISVSLQGEDVRKYLSLMIATMHLRNPIQRLEYEAIGQDFAQFIMTEMNKAGVDEVEFIDANERPTGVATRAELEKRLSGDPDYEKESWHYSIRHAHEMAETLMNMRWYATYLSAPNLITSDNPVVIFNNDGDAPALKKPGTMIQFPLHPTLLLHLDNKKGPDGRYYASDEHTIPNALAYKNRYQKIFSPREPTAVIKEIRPWFHQM